MKKYDHKNAETDDYELMGSFKPKIRQRIKQKRIYTEDFEKETGEKAARKYGQKGSKKIKLKGGQWEDWDS
ncbi:MAG: hypothetical protein HQ517_07395 [SAR324 cluster bacterium]|nr:hypothetical protein [SAR324 cluster bacterium]